MKKINIAIAGTTGRMGKMLVQAVFDNPATNLCGALVHPEDTMLGKELILPNGEASSVMYTANATEALANADIVIDFTRPEASLSLLPVCVEKNIGLVLGTTGFDEAGKTAIHEAGKKIGIVFSANFSIGVNATLVLLAQTARMLNKGYDIEVIEAHHKHKVDAPSGTALRMGEVLAQATGRKLDDCAVYTRHGHTGEREPDTIGFATIRAGDIVGEHTVMFATEGERIEITHKASSRMIFANGAVRAGVWLTEKTAGVYDMQDVLVG